MNDVLLNFRRVKCGFKARQLKWLNTIRMRNVYVPTKLNEKMLKMIATDENKMLSCLESSRDDDEVDEDDEGVEEDVFVNRLQRKRTLSEAGSLFTPRVAKK